MRILDTIEGNCHRLAVIDTGRGEVTFTLNDDGTIYALSPDGGALQDSESDFMDNASDAERDELRGIVGTLEGLAALINSGATLSDNYMTHLPTFGGEEPDWTHNIWSWDATHFLVQRSDRFVCVRREEIES